MRKLIILFNFCLSFFISHWAWSQGVSVTANVDRNKMRPGDTFVYSVSVTSENNLSMDNPKLPDLTAFSIVNSWSDSQVSATFTNGQLQTIRSQNYKYMLATRSSGQFTIGATEVTV